MYDYKRLRNDNIYISSVIVFNEVNILSYLCLEQV
jgi:hypothetical protein